MANEGISSIQSNNPRTPKKQRLPFQCPDSCEGLELSALRIDDKSRVCVCVCVCVCVRACVHACVYDCDCAGSEKEEMGYSLCDCAK